jgi:hypothetical protein
MTREETEAFIIKARQARLAKQLQMYNDLKRKDENLLDTEISEEEDEDYIVKTDETGEIEVVQKDEEQSNE